MPDGHPGDPGRQARRHRLDRRGLRPRRLSRRSARDAITLSPYLGRDSLEPFLADPAHGVFLLCKTSNPGSADLQDLPLADRMPAQRFTSRWPDLARGWNRNDNLGLVVGATHPEALRRVRQLAPELWILAPGVGAQGGDLETALRAGLRADGLGLLVPVSRAISRAADPRQARCELVEEMHAVRASSRRSSAAPAGSARRSRGSLQVPCPLPPRRWPTGCWTAGCVRFGQFTLKSGLQLADLPRPAPAGLPPGAAGPGAAAYAELLRELKFDRLAALPYAALPIATAISLQGGWPMIYPRKEAKAYGTGAEIEGDSPPASAPWSSTTWRPPAGSKFEAIDKLTAAGLKVRGRGRADRPPVRRGRSAGGQAGYRLHAVLTLSQMLDHWEQTGRVPAAQIAATRAVFGTINVKEPDRGYAQMWKRANVLTPKGVEQMTVDYSLTNTTGQAISQSDTGPHTHL